MPIRSSGAFDLNGSWVPVAADISGRALDVAEMRVARFIIEYASYRIVDRDERTVDEGELRLDETAMPCALDLVGIDGPHAGRCLYAIIEQDGERLRICYDLERGERPRSMQPVDAEQLLLTMTYVREVGRRPMRLS